MVAPFTGNITMHHLQRGKSLAPAKYRPALPLISSGYATVEGDLNTTAEWVSNSSWSC